VTIWNLCQAYLAADSRLESSTADLAQRAFDCLTQAVGDIRVIDFSFRHAQRFQSWVIDGRRRVTANIYVKAVRPVFRWAINQDLIAEDPFAKLKLFKVPDNPINIYDRPEFLVLLAAAPGILWRARILLAKTAGLRRGEVLNLTNEDVDFGRGIIRIQQKREARTTWRWVAKDKDYRELPLVAELAVLLREIIEQLPEAQPYLMITADRYDRLMKLKRSGALNDRIRRCPDENFAKPFRKIKKAAGLKTGTFHDLRRTCITEWLECGLEPHEAMRLAGHADVDTTMRYYVTVRRSLLDKARKASSQGLAGLPCAQSA